VPLVANFTANVTEGEAPLAVRFTDQSTGNVTAWAWDFGDGNSSTEQNPTHTYMAPGIYTVTLTVTRAGASDTETKTNYIVVTSSSTTWHDTLLNTGEGKPGTLMPGGYLEFRVAGAYSKVTIGGTQHDLAIGDTVKLVIGTSGKGKIYIRESWISTFAYDDVTLFINGEESGTGKINEVDGIWIANYEDLISTLTLNVPPVNAWTEFTVGGTPIINRIDDNRQITLSNLMPRKDGQMNLDNSPGEEKIWFEGSISSYTLG
jgi:PKD repeat protein